MKKFYDLRPDTPLSDEEIARLHHETQIDRERRVVERVYKRGNERGLRRALATLHAREKRPLR